MQESTLCLSSDLVPLAWMSGCSFLQPAKSCRVLVGLCCLLLWNFSISLAPEFISGVNSQGKEGDNKAPLQVPFPLKPVLTDLRRCLSSVTHWL